MKKAIQMKVAAFALVITSGCLWNPAHAQGAQVQPGATLHPSYFRAFDDLTAARHYLNDGWSYAPVRTDTMAAVREIDGALQEIKSAAIEKGRGRDLADTSRPDLRISPHDRVRKAQELLAAAHQQMAQENVPSERDLEHRITDHIDSARNIVDRAESTGKWEK